MPIASRWSTPLPEVSLPVWVFGSPNGPLADNQVFIDAENPSRALSFSEFRQYSKRIAAGLLELGVCPGDRVLLYSGNELFVPCLFFGVVMAGAIFTGASPAFNARELAYQLQDSGATMIISAAAALDVAVEAAKIVGLSHSRIFSFDGLLAPSSAILPHSVAHWTNLLASDAETETFKWFEPENVHTATCCLNYSSGTTGKPKGVEVTHFSYVANGESSIFRRHLEAKAWGGAYKETSLCFMPLYHAAAQTMFIINAPKGGTTTYVMPAFNFEKLLQHIQNFRVTELLGAPPIFLALVGSPLTKKYDLSSIKTILCGTAPLAPALGQKAGQIWKDERVQVRQGWGMTEITCGGTICDPNLKYLTSSVGEPLPNSAIKLMDGDTEITEANKSGELWFTGPALMKGYWRNPEATEEAFAVDEEGRRWLKTGDIVYVDSYGPGANIHIIDRAKELIKVKGFQVAPAELEAVLLTHPAVVDVGVIGVTINGQEMPRAYIVKAPSSKDTADDICKWMEDKVAPYKRLRGGVVFLDAIPRVQSGKILRRVLRDLARSDLGQGIVAQPKLA
ncbi:4-coumarate--CoA ligase isoform 6 [Cladobotryum mycophilum]|uniref:4-coumarate--CoA ligase isoform 6 n=1 Tax=Cladobotryum mycophilum TaxID=491253 RepID=A0ABR0S7U8_9HYPO